jgi:hypothetical protein
MSVDYMSDDEIPVDMMLIDDIYVDEQRRNFCR